MIHCWTRQLEDGFDGAIKVKYVISRYFCSEDYDASLEQEVNAGYLRFLQAKEDSERTEGTRLGKRKKKEKVRYYNSC